MKRAFAIALASCSGTTAAPTRPASRARPAIATIDAAPSISAPIPTACLPDSLPDGIVSLDVEGSTIGVCFDNDHCVAIDRHGTAIRSGTTHFKTPPFVHRLPRAATIEPSSDKYHRMDVCAENDCATFHYSTLDGIGAPLTADLNDDSGFMLLTAADSSGSPGVEFWLLNEALDRKTKLAVGLTRCGSAVWVDKLALVTTDDCNGGNARGSLFDKRGNRVATVGGPHAIDTNGAFAINGPKTWILIAPRAYALVLFDGSAVNQTVVDLVPIQA